MMNDKNYMESDEQHEEVVENFIMDSLNEIVTSSDRLVKDILPKTLVLEDEVERIMEPNAEDFLWFGLKKGGKHFKIGLSDILLCLKFAEEQGEVPELPPMWWTQVSGVYPKLESQKDKMKKGAGDW